MCFVWIWEQTAIISLYSINWLVCITDTECVYCAVRTGSLSVGLNTELSVRRPGFCRRSVRVCLWCSKRHRYNFLSQYFSSPVSTLPPNAPHFSSSTCCFHQKDKWTKPGNLSQEMLFHKSRNIPHTDVFIVSRVWIMNLPAHASFLQSPVCSDVSGGLALKPATYWAQCTLFVSMDLIAQRHSLQSVSCEHQMQQFMWLYKQMHNMYNILSLNMIRIHRNMLECLLLLIYIYIYIYVCMGDRGGTVVKVLCCKSEGRWFDPLGSTQPLTEMSTRSISWG